MNIEPGKTARRLGTLVPNPHARLRDQFHEVCRFKYFSPRTEDSYWQWVVRFLKFHRTPDGLQGNAALPNHGWRHPKELGATEVAAFLSDLANRQRVAAATQAQALRLVES